MWVLLFVFLREKKSEKQIPSETYLSQGDMRNSPEHPTFCWGNAKKQKTNEQTKQLYPLAVAPCTLSSDSSPAFQTSPFLLRTQSWALHTSHWLSLVSALSDTGDGSRVKADLALRGRLHMAAVWSECRKYCLTEPSDAPSASCMVLDLTQGDATGNTCRRKKRKLGWIIKLKPQLRKWLF